MRRRAAGPIVVLALLAALLLGGCGGGDDAPTKAEFVAKGDAYCAKANAKAEHAFLSRNLQKAPNHAEEDQFYVEEIYPQVNKMIAGLEGLGVPREGGAAAQKVVRAYRSALQRAEAKPEIMFHEEPFEQAHKLAKAYGFKACAGEY